MGYSLIQLPSCFSRADGGFTNPNGTPLPGPLVGVSPASNNGLNYFQFNYNGQSYKVNGGVSPYGHIMFIEEQSDSPQYDFGEQSTITHRFLCDLYTGQNALRLYKRGYQMVDYYGNITRVLSANLQPQAKSNTQVCNLTIISEAMSFGVPPDEFSIEPVEFNPALEKHPRYVALTYQDKDWIRSATISDNINVRQTYISFLNTLSGSLTSNLTSLTNERAQALELMLKRQKGEETFYLSGFKMTYSQYFWAPTFINPGGYIENPFTVIPYQYWTDGVYGLNVFSYISQINHNLYPNASNTPSSPPYGLSWLRQTDTQVLNRTWYKSTQTWLGFPLSQWDNELYNPTFQPYQTQQTQGTVNGLS